MTVEKPLDTAHVWMVNAIDQPVDVYINYAAQPTITDVKSLELGPQFKVQGKDSTPYGTYTFSARPKADPTAPILATVSIVFAKGWSFTAILHFTSTGGRQFSVYENDFSASGGTSGRMTVRHTARPPQIAWRIAPKDAKPEIPLDERDGTLMNSQWQVATNVVQNNYLFEVLVNGAVVAMHPDLELEHEKDRSVYVVGDPQPTTDPLVLRRHVIEQEFQLPPGPTEPGQVTVPAEPVWTTDENAPIEFSCEPLELWQTNATSTQVSAVDPDGVVTNLSIDHVAPAAGGIRMAGAVTPASSIGGQALRTVEVLKDVSAGTYAVTIVANRGSMGHHATCIQAITVKPITIARLQDQAAFHQASGDIQDGFADTLQVVLAQAQQHLDAGEAGLACQKLKDFLALIGSEKDKAITVPAHDHLERETKAFRSALGCG